MSRVRQVEAEGGGLARGAAEPAGHAVGGGPRGRLLQTVREALLRRSPQGERQRRHRGPETAQGAGDSTGRGYHRPETAQAGGITGRSQNRLGVSQAGGCHRLDVSQAGGCHRPEVSQAGCVTGQRCHRLEVFRHDISWAGGIVGQRYHSPLLSQAVGIVG